MILGPFLDYSVPPPSRTFVFSLYFPPLGAPSPPRDLDLGERWKIQVVDVFEALLTPFKVSLGYDSTLPRERKY